MLPQLPLTRCLVAALLVVGSGATVEIELDEMGSGACTTTQYFDTTNLVCRSCTNGCSGVGAHGNCFKVPDYEAGVDPYGNALTCTCAAGYERVEQWYTEYDDGDGDWPGGSNIAFVCRLPVDSHRTARSDGDGTAQCGPSTGGKSAAALDCTCGVAPSADAVLFSLPVLVEDDEGGSPSANKSCVACAAGSGVVSTAGTYGGVAFKKDLYSCQRCPDPHMDMAKDRCLTCDASAGYATTPYGVSEVGPLTCVYAAHATFAESSFNTGSSGYTIRYANVQDTPDGDATLVETVTNSLTFKHYLINATANCYFYKGPENSANCQTLANLCVLQLYDAKSGACEAFAAIESAREQGSYAQEGWGTSLPWLHYDGIAAEVRSEETIEMTLALDNAAVVAENADASELTFYVSVTALNGTWLGLEELTTQFFYCPFSGPRSGEGGGTGRSTTWRRFGNSFSETTLCDLDRLASMEALFYELFVKDALTGKLFPVPVLLTDLVDYSFNPLGDPVNQNNDVTDEEDDVFVRRFSLFDNEGGVTAGYTDGYPKVLRYAYDIQLQVNSFPNDAARILPPILKVSYRSRLPHGGNWEAGMARDSVVFGVEYAMERGDYLDTLYGFFTTASVLAALAAFMRWQNWSFRNLRAASLTTPAMASGRAGNRDRGETDGMLGGGGSAGYDLTMAGRSCGSIQRLLHSQQWAGILITAHSFTVFNFGIILGLCTVFFVLFKMQSRSQPAYILLPPHTGYLDEGDDYYFVYVVVFTMAVSQTAFVCHLIYLQCTTETFFVDMENPSNAVGDPIAAQGREPSISGGNGSPRRAGQGGSGVATLAAEGSVSAWRRVFMANEWNRLQGTRRTSLEVTLFVMTLLLLGQNLENLATPQPNLDDHRPDSCGADRPLNMLLRFASTTWWFILLEMVQLGVEKGRAYLAPCGLEGEPLGQQFVDLCTMAKVSVLLLDDTYHGYLLYCDSSADTADASLRALTRQLLVEMKGHVTSRRGPAHLADRPGFEDVQTFELYVGDGWLRWYRTLRHRLEVLALKHPNGLTVKGPDSDFGLRGRNAAPARRGGLCGALGLEERSGVVGVGGMEVLSDKLRKFFRRQYRGADLEWEAVPALEGSSAWAWRLLRAVPREIAEARVENALVPDHGNRFTSCGLYGIEFELWLRDVLTFAILDMWFDDTATSIALTYLSYQLLRASRIFIGKRTLAQTSLIDKTFLF